MFWIITGISFLAGCGVGVAIVLVQFAKGFRL